MVEMVDISMEEIEIRWRWDGEKRNGNIIGQKIITFYFLGNSSYEWCKPTQWAAKYIRNKGAMVEWISLKGVMLDLCFLK